MELKSAIEQLHLLDLRDVVSDYLDLDTRRQGKIVSILCPAHNDEHFGSCVVNQNSCHCFACGWHGDIIELTQKAKNIDFITATKLLCSYSGIRLDERSETPPKKSLKIESEKLELIGINDSSLLKELYAENRKAFWAYISKCFAYTKKEYMLATETETNEAVLKILRKNMQDSKKLLIQLTEAKKQNTSDTILVITSKRTC